MTRETIPLLSPAAYDRLVTDIERTAGIDMAPVEIEPLGATADCGSCGRRVPDREVCQDCHNFCTNPSPDCPGRDQEG